MNKLLLTTAIVASIMAFRTDKSGDLRLSLWDGEGFRSAVITRASAPYGWFRAHVSRENAATFADSTAITVEMEFTGDTVRSVR